jgi:DNA-binding NtrC family response regulator
MIENKDVKILLVDDDQLSLESLRTFLRSEGYDIEAYTEIDKARESFLKADFDVVASDYMIRDPNGLDLLNHVKLIRPKTFTILFTGYSSDEILQDNKFNDIDLFLTKPIPLYELIELFEKLKEQKKVKERQNRKKGEKK